MEMFSADADGGFEEGMGIVDFVEFWLGVT